MLAVSSLNYAITSWYFFLSEAENLLKGAVVRRLISATNFKDTLLETMLT